MTKITVTKALAEIKKLDKQIAKLIANSAFIGVEQSGYIMGFTQASEAEKAFKGNFDRINSLQARRKQIKAKLTASNAATKVTIGGVIMTVAEAIERKDSISMDKSLLVVMQKQFHKANIVIDRTKERIQREIEAKVEQVFGNAKKLDENDSTYKAIAKQVEAANAHKLVDPIGLAKKIEALEESIEDFETDVDVALSVVNATTTIEI